MARLAQAVRDPAETLAFAVDAVVRKEASQALATDEEEAPGGGRSEPVPLLHS
jgi:hypothetical protein